jgi:hypothetical protein
MTDKLARLDAALEEVVAAARAHLGAIRAADGEPDDETVWQAYVALNNASHRYDDLLNDLYGEVTPWDVEEITADWAHAGRVGVMTTGTPGDLVGSDDPYPHIVSVRQRRDYRVPSVMALLRIATEARVPESEGGPSGPVDSVGEAVLELLQSGDGSLGMLDVAELEPLDGVVVVVDVADPYGPHKHEADPESPFRLAVGDRMTDRLDERALPDLNEPS